VIRPGGPVASYAEFLDGFATFLDGFATELLPLQN
jgi:hypothetical protein